MRNRKFLLGVLVLALVFGMTLVGCEKEETNPSPPTGLTGTAASSTSVSLTWNSVNNADEYWIKYAKKSSGPTQTKEGIKTASYTVLDLIPATEYDFQVAVTNKDGYTSDFSSAISVTTLPSATGSVSLSLTARHTVSTSGYQIGIFLKLNEGSYWNSAPAGNTAKSWVTVTGIDVSGWTFQADYDSVLAKDTLSLWFTTISTTAIDPSGGITVTIDQTKLTEMKNYTNVTSSINLGSPSSASFSAWQ